MANKIKCCVCQGDVPPDQLPKKPSERTTCCNEHRQFAAQRPKTKTNELQRLWKHKVYSAQVIDQFIYAGRC